MKPDKNTNKVCDESVFLVLDEGSTTRGTANIGPGGESIRVCIKSIPRNYRNGVCEGCVFSARERLRGRRALYQPDRGIVSISFGCGGGYPHCIRNPRPTGTELVWVAESARVTRDNRPPRRTPV